MFNKQNVLTFPIPPGSMVWFLLLVLTGVSLAEPLSNENKMSGSNRAISPSTSLEPEYTYDNPARPKLLPADDPQRQYEKIIIRKMLREKFQDAEAFPVETEKNNTTKRNFTIYGFSSIPETTVSTLIIVGGLWIFRRRKRG